MTDDLADPLDQARRAGLTGVLSYSHSAGAGPHRNRQATLDNMRLLGDWNEYFRAALAWRDQDRARRARAGDRRLPRSHRRAGSWTRLLGGALPRAARPSSVRWRTGSAKAWDRLPKLPTRHGIKKIFRIRLEALDLLPDFGEVVDDVQRPATPRLALSELTRLAAHGYLRDDHVKYMG
jgi:hypothetical protein